MRFLVFVLAAAACRKSPPAPTPVADPVVQTAAAAPSVISDAVIDQLIETFQKVHFELDSAKLTEESMAALAANAKVLQKYPRIRIEVEGHADERGTSDYNLALGDRRARAVTTYLGEMGVAAGRVRVVSYGEEKPEVEGHDESAWSKNRRCEFRVIVPDGNVKGTVER